MKISIYLKKWMGWSSLAILIFLFNLQGNYAVAQAIPYDDPNLDQIPQIFRSNTNTQKSSGLPLSTVITVNNWDNFNLGTDFGESNMAANPAIPSWYFTAYNTNVGHHTENGVDWLNTVPNFGATMQGDPVVAYDSLGNLFYENMYGSGSIVGCKVVKSTDNGATWGTGVTSIAGNDKNWIACDQTSGPYANYIYTTMTNNSAGNFARSTDHGASFQSTFAPTTQALPGMMVAVGPYNNIQGGSVYVVTNSGSSFASTYTFYRSLDGGANFNLMSSKQFAGYVGTNVSSRNSVEGMRTRPYPMIAADNSYGPNRGTFYVVYASNDPPGNGNKPDIWCRSSTDGGVNWSSAIRVNDDPNTTTNHQWHPAIWCDKETGRLYAMWMDTRDCPTHDSALIYASYSDNGGATWAANQAISNKKMKINCTTCGGGGTPRYQGDYNGIVSNKKVAQAGWTDFRNGTFMSATAYFPDFAMALDHATDTLYTNGSDSANFAVSIPEVKLYTDTVVLSGVVTPTPTAGTIEFHYPNGNTITSYPNSKTVRVVLYGNVPVGNYSANFYAKGPNGTPSHMRKATIKVLVGNGYSVAATANPSTICQGQTSQLNAAVSGGTAPFTYSWTPTQGLSDPTIANPVATPMTTTAYSVTVSDGTANITNSSVTVNVNLAPATPGPISGATSGCAGDTLAFTIVAVPGADTYSWTVPADAQILEGQNTTMITVAFGSTTGSVSVIAGNSCGNSTPSVLPVEISMPPAALEPITGSSKVCKATDVTFTVTPVLNVVTYNWSVPADAVINSGAGTNSIQVTWGQHLGDVTVFGENNCGITPTVTKTVAVDSMPAAAGMISGKDTVCKGQNGYTFSIDEVSGATGYVWTVPVGTTINGASDGKQITLDITEDAANGTILVKAVNDCGNGTESSKEIVVSTCAGLPDNVLNGNVFIYPNPTDRILNISFKSPNSQANISITDVKGQTIYTETLKNVRIGDVKQIQVSTFAKGVYFLHVKNKDQVYTEKFVVN